MNGPSASAGPAPLSVCLISGAEAARIGRALESVAGLAAETVVVLNEDVHDGTEEICRRHGARVFREPWKGHVAQKNSAAGKATQPWILGLDADEALTPELRAEIAALLAEPARAAQHAAYSFPRLSFFLGRWIRHGDWYPDRKLRLWQRGRARWAGIDPHDSLAADGPAGRLRADLLHFSNPTMGGYVQKLPYFADLHLRQQLAAGARWSAPAAVVRSAWRFVRAYGFRLGFLDGYPGFFIAVTTAYGALVRHTRLYEHLHAVPPGPPATATQAPDSRPAAADGKAGAPG